MKMRLLILGLGLSLAQMAFGGTYTLNDWCFYVNTPVVSQNCNDGAGSNNFVSPVSPGTFDYSNLYADGNGLGSVVVNLSPGTYNIFALWDYDITAVGGFNEYASTSGSLATGQHFSVDAEFDPSAFGGITAYTPGNLYANQFLIGAFDDTNHLTQASCTTAGSGNCEDVSVGLSWSSLTVPVGMSGTVNFTVSSSAPSSGFYIVHADVDSGQQLYYSSTVDITSGGGGGSVPEPATLALMGIGLGSVLMAARRRRTARG